ncbi:tRNA:m(4)X modification enzyme TRM13-like [Salvia miltiorrhiza]|uniref:tRNA:m(4)X modification enzyme TRM13-like n=1 Tax=Salvia miltiorrhiza TaxID=226208 RepID=UPI0025ABC664|nr:tRNA:m(4)X modification enzyme TRM13-like [Salvia miltiorrhiza]
MATQCKFWLPKKRRFCANSPLLDSPFCGNHTQRSDAQWIPCPIDPSHSVLEENLETHLHRCPLLKQTQSLSRQPYYQKGINAGDDDDEEKEEDSSHRYSTFTSEMKRNAVYSMPLPKFLDLIAKIKSIHASICSTIPDSYRIPEACSIWTNREVDKKLPYKEKHVLQQASILGNLENFGVLRESCSSSGETSEEKDSKRERERDSDVPAVVEFGAGRGYLTQVLADCYGIKKVLLVERKSYKLKADRSLRQKESLVLDRLRIDIEDLNLNAVESLKGVGYIAIGKHLCGPATDMTLRCCIRQHSNENEAVQSQASCYLRGLAIATCCHHLCQWKSYISKKYISDMGFTKEDFHAITWFTSWAVDADHGSDFPVIDFSTQLEIMTTEKKELLLDTESCKVEDIVKNMQPIDRAVLGYMCKDIIDAARLMWAKAQGLKCELVKYVPVTISPENRVLMAK